MYGTGWMLRRMRQVPLLPLGRGTGGARLLCLAAVGRRAGKGGGMLKTGPKKAEAIQLSASLEDYLETILFLNKKSPGEVRPVDVANHLGITKPSVTRAMTELEKDGHITRNEKGRLLLTESGREIAENVYEKHQVITKLFAKCANVSEETAESDACKVEHVISEETFKGIKSYLDAMSGIGEG